MRYVPFVLLVVGTFLATGSVYVALAYGGNHLAEHLLGYRLEWKDADYLWNLLVVGGFVVIGGLAAACVAARFVSGKVQVAKYLRASLAVAVSVTAWFTVYGDLIRLASSHMEASQADEAPIWVYASGIAALIGIAAAGWFFWRGLVREDS